MSGSHHRVNGSNYRNYVNQNVRIIGQIMEKDSNHFSIQTTDGKKLTIIMNERSQIDNIESEWVEVSGIVQGDLSILESITYGIHTEVPIDCQVWNEAIQLMEKFNQIF